MSDATTTIYIANGDEVQDYVLPPQTGINVGYDGVLYLIDVNIDTPKYQLKLTTEGQTYEYYYHESGSLVLSGRELDGRNINDYIAKLYPNKAEWAESFVLQCSPYPYLGNNGGDVPAPFIVSKSSMDANTTLKVADCEIVVQEACSDFKWDGKTGLVTGKVGSETKARPIKYTGKSYGAIPVGGTDNISLAGATLEYDYWYY